MVDDGSTDSSGEIMDEYAAEYENFKSIHLQENSGAAGKPKNCGLDHATAEYLMFLDADDYYNDDACEVLYNEIKKATLTLYQVIIFMFMGIEQKNSKIFKMK